MRQHTTHNNTTKTTTTNTSTVSSSAVKRTGKRKKERPMRKTDEFDTSVKSDDHRYQSENLILERMKTHNPFTWLLVNLKTYVNPQSDLHLIYRQFFFPSQFIPSDISHNTTESDIHIESVFLPRLISDAKTILTDPRNRQHLIDVAIEYAVATNRANRLQSWTPELAVKHPEMVFFDSSTADLVSLYDYMIALIPPVSLLSLCRYLLTSNLIDLVNTRDSTSEVHVSAHSINLHYATLLTDYYSWSVHDLALYLLTHDEATRDRHSTVFPDLDFPSSTDDENSVFLKPIEPITFESMPMIHDVYDAFFGEHNSNVIHYLTKVRPKKSAIRMTPSVIGPKMAHCRWFRLCVIRMLMCTRLGNYRDSDPASKPDAITRIMLYQEWINAARTDSHMSWLPVKLLLLTVDNLFVASARQYMYHRIQNCPPLLQACKTIFKFDRFKQIVQTTCSAIMCYVNKHRSILMTVENCARTFSEAELTDAIAVVRGFKHLIEKNCKRQILEICYPKYNHFFKKAINIDSKRPLNQVVSGLVTPKLVTAENIDLLIQLISRIDPQDQFPERFMYKWATAFGVCEDALSGIQEILHQYRHGNEVDKDIASFQRQHPYTYSYVEAFSSSWQRHSSIQLFPAPEHYLRNQIQAIQERLGLKVDAEHAVLPETNTCVYMCGVCHRVCTAVVTFPTYVVSTRWDPHIKRFGVINRLPSRDIHVYHNGSSDIKITSTPLPMHHQATALTGCNDERVTIKNINQNWYYQSLSNITDATDPGTRCGMINVTNRIDMETGLFIPYCNGSSEFNGEVCGQYPLRKICLLGRIMLRYESLMFICPQPGCGLVAILDASVAAYTEHGYCCAHCTARLRNAQVYSMNALIAQTEAERKTTASYDEQQDDSDTGNRSSTRRAEFAETCDLCGAVVKQHHKIRELMFGVRCCPNHHLPRQGIKHHLDRIKVTELVNPMCQDASNCMCDNMSTTCTGKPGRGVVIKLMRNWQSIAISLRQVEPIKKKNRGGRWSGASL